MARRLTARRLTDLTGKKFGRLLVIKHSHANKNNSHFWECKCDCGNIVKVCISNLNSGTKSCGCLKEEYRKFGFHSYGIKHGMHNTHFYRRWSRMKERCSSKKKIYYYGRGIKVCKRWLEFENFKEDMHESYLEHVDRHGEKDTSIDRIDNDGNYEPGNCKWATFNEQNSNKRTNKFLTYKGIRKTYAQWSKTIGGTRGIIKQRIDRGWTIEEVLFTPSNKKYAKHSRHHEIAK